MAPYKFLILKLLFSEKSRIIKQLACTHSLIDINLEHDMHDFKYVLTSVRNDAKFFPNLKHISFSKENL